MARISWTSVIGCVALLLTAFLYHHTFDEASAVSAVTAGRGPVFFPRIVLGAMLVLSLAVIYEGSKDALAPVAPRQLLLVGAALGLTGLYIAAIMTAGFLIATTVFVFALPWLLGYRNLTVIGIMTAVYPVAVWYVFERLFKIVLPSSPWLDAF